MLFFFFFNDTATTEIYTLSLHDALPISCNRLRAMKLLHRSLPAFRDRDSRRQYRASAKDRKSTRLNSSHGYISYAVFCLKKKNNPLYARIRAVTHTCDRLSSQCEL